MFLWVLKGGPGCGKSTLMKRIGSAAEAEGEQVEYIHCSGDPDSLDAVSVPLRGFAFVDGTAPHVIEAACPGAASRYLDLSRFLDDGALRPRLAEIMELERRYKACYADAYAKLTALGELLPENAPGLRREDALRAAERAAEELAARELPSPGGHGMVRRRYLSAWTCRGRVTFAPDLPASAHVTLVESELGLGSVFLAKLGKLAIARGCGVVLCADPLEPEKTEAVLLPEAGLAYCAAGGGSPEIPGAKRSIPLDRFAGETGRPDLSWRRSESERLIQAAVGSLHRAKELHDELELLYRPHVDFSGVSALTDALIRRLFP